MAERHLPMVARGVAADAASDKAAASPARIRATAQLALSLFKLRVVGMVTFTAVAAMVVASEGNPSVARLSVLILAGTLAGAGAGGLNHYLDRDLDAIMSRTRNRPLPSGLVSPSHVLTSGLALVMLGTGLATWLGISVAIFVLMASVTYVLAYTRWLKRRTPWNVVLGGWTGSCAILAGWEAAGNGLSITAWALAAIVFFWTPSHFWTFAIANVEDYRRAGIPMLPVVSGVRRSALAIIVGALLTVAASLIPHVMAPGGVAYLIVALPAGGAFVGGTIWLARSPSKARAYAVYGLSNLYLFSLFVGLLADIWIG